MKVMKVTRLLLYTNYMQKDTNSDGPAFHVYTYQKAFLHLGTSLHKIISSVQNIVIRICSIHVS